MSETNDRDRLRARYRQLGAERVHATPAAADRPKLTQAHREVVNMLDELLQLAESTTRNPAAVAMTRALRRMEANLLEQFANVDATTVVDFIERIATRLTAAVAAARAEEPGDDGPVAHLTSA